MGHARGVLAWLLLVALAFLASPCQAQRDCRVRNFKPQLHFDKYQYSGVWYAIAKKDPEGLFLQSNVIAQFSADESGNFTAIAKGRVEVWKGQVMCVTMLGTFMDTEDPAKFMMQYHGTAAFLQKGYDPHWVIATDYTNFALHYSCRRLNDDGTCADSYSFVFSRSPYGLSQSDQRIVRQKQTELCLDRQYKLIAHDEPCP
ncbi:retinol-binding protein 4 [Elgaria multicarinata webbii]|uniref:retinol-binding protein 4 n=1 Tax=Elgaria multicarinata webbii TaxID=159646 RepID=UPI002FCD58B7